jgi:hypothetical protein
MLEVADGVFEIGVLFVHAHLVVVDDGVVLVDTGLPGRSARIEQALREAWLIAARVSARTVQFGLRASIRNRWEWATKGPSAWIRWWSSASWRR